MYGENAPAKHAEASLDQIEIANIPDRDGQMLRNNLMDRFYSHGLPQNPAYLLKIEQLTKTVTDMGIRKDATYTRGEMAITAVLTLVDKSTMKPVLTRNLRSVGSYNLLDNQFATVISERDTTDRVLGEMSDNIVTHLSLYFNRAGTP